MACSATMRRRKIRIASAVDRPIRSSTRAASVLVSSSTRTWSMVVGWAVPPHPIPWLRS